MYNSYNLNLPIDLPGACVVDGPGCPEPIEGMTELWL